MTRFAFLAILTPLLVACYTDGGDRERAYIIKNGLLDTIEVVAHGNDTVVSFAGIAPAQSRTVESCWDIVGGCDLLLGFFLADSVLVKTSGTVVRRYFPSDTGRNILARSQYVQTLSSDNHVEYTFTVTLDTAQ